MAIQDREQRASVENSSQASPGVVACTSFANIARQVLGYQCVSVFAVDPPEDRLRLLGISGLSPEQEQRCRAATNQVALRDFLDETATRQLHANQLVTLNWKQFQGIASKVFPGVRNWLIAPMVLREQLVGLFIIAKNDKEYSDSDSAYTLEERELAREIAALITRIIERVYFLERWAKTHADELAAQEVNRRYDTFLTIASHELRTPLTGVKGNIQLALRHLARMKQQGEHLSSSVASLNQLQLFLDYALQSSDRLKRIVRILLDVSRIQVDALPLTMRPYNLVEIVRRVVENARKKVTDRAILLSLPESEMVQVIADADRIAQVIENYLSNALKYSPPPYPIEVQVALEAVLVRVLVRDRGPGLSLEEQALIWERFYRIPGIEAHYKDGADLGLGLYLCRAIIERHHGQVGVSSVPGEGSTFWFTLPLQQTGQSL